MNVILRAIQVRISYGCGERTFHFVISRYLPHPEMGPSKSHKALLHSQHLHLHRMLLMESCHTGIVGERVEYETSRAFHWMRGVRN
jgi:hypothetical protein